MIARSSEYPRKAHTSISVGIQVSSSGLNANTPNTLGGLAGWLGWLVADWLGWAGWAGQQVAHRLRGGARGAGLERSWELPGPAWAQARAWLGGPGPAQNKKWTTFPFIFSSNKNRRDARPFVSSKILGGMLV